MLFGLQISIAVTVKSHAGYARHAGSGQPADLPTLQAGHCQQREERAEDPGYNARIPPIQQHGENTLSDSVMLRSNWQMMQMVLRFLMLAILSHGV